MIFLLYSASSEFDSHSARSIDERRYKAPEISGSRAGQSVGSPDSPLTPLPSLGVNLPAASGGASLGS